MADNGADSMWARLWRRPDSKWLLGIPIGGFIAAVFGAIALGTMNYTLHKTSENEFCYTCHSHEAFIKPEYEASSHFRNQHGVRADCADCHLPHDDWFELVTTKIIVSFDIIPELMGKIDTAEKYEAHRAELAQTVWRHFKENDSKFCRSCHSFDAMDFEQQDRRAARRHEQATGNGETCIDCHYGLVHEEPDNAAELMREIAAEFGKADAAGG